MLRKWPATISATYKHHTVQQLMTVSADSGRQCGRQVCSTAQQGANGTADRGTFYVGFGRGTVPQTLDEPPVI